MRAELFIRYGQEGIISSDRGMNNSRGKSMREEKKKDRVLLFAISLAFTILMCGCVGKEEITKEPLQENSEMNGTVNMGSPTVYPDVPPYYVMLDGTLMQIKEKADGDYSKYKSGTLTYTGDLYRLPEEDGQTNYTKYEGCDVAFKDDTWYMFFSVSWFGGGWYRLGPDE